MRISELLNEDLILPDLSSQDRKGVFREIVRFLKKNNHVTKDKELLERLLHREKMGSTAIGGGVAIPHCKFGDIRNPLVMISLSRTGIEFKAVDEKPVHLFFTVITSPDTPGDNLQILALIANLVRRSRSLIKKISQAGEKKTILDIIREEEERAHG